MADLKAWSHGVRKANLGHNLHLPIVQLKNTFTKLAPLVFLVPEFGKSLKIGTVCRNVQLNLVNLND